MAKLVEDLTKNNENQDKKGQAKTCPKEARKLEKSFKNHRKIIEKSSKNHRTIIENGPPNGAPKSRKIDPRGGELAGN